MDDTTEVTGAPAHTHQAVGGSRRRRTRVAVVFGGRSAEHGISCSTAAGVLTAIDRERYDVLPIGITRTGQWVLAPDDSRLLAGGRAEITAGDGQVLLPLGDGGNGGELLLAERGKVPAALGEVDVVLPLLHGPYGEDGTVQGLLEMAGVRYVGSGVLASAVGMDKHYMKVVLAGHGLPVGPYVTVTPRRWRTDRATVLDAVASLTFPVFVKPARGGSSLGITRVERPEDVPAAVATAQEHDPKVIVEAGLSGRELECAVLQGRGDDGPRTAAPGEIVVDGDPGVFYDYESKYFTQDGVTLSCPAELPAEDRRGVQDMAAAAFEALGCEGLARVDFFYDAGRIVVNEVNTMPGFTPYSMYPTMWERSGLSYPELVDELIQLALERPPGLR